jgi:NAD(P)-dependent dehydrogenase (short-subunit alcohol dehydrogenase family)
VVLGARRVDRLPETGALVEAAGRRYAYEQTDVTDPEQCERLVQKAVSEFGRVDVLVNNAGFGWAKPASRETPAEFLKVLDVNLNGAYWMAQAFARAATGGGAIVNISSVIGLRPGILPQAAYASSKAGLIGLTRDLAQQWTGRKGIRVNAIAPGLFPTEMSDQLDDSEAEMVKAVTPAGRSATPPSWRPVCVFLASDAAAYVTGVTLAVDGGMTMH